MGRLSKTGKLFVVLADAILLTSKLGGVGGMSKLVPMFYSNSILCATVYCYCLKFVLYKEENISLSFAVDLS